MKRHTYKVDGIWSINGVNGKLVSDKYANYRGKAIDRLAEYEDMEEQGLLVRLPCRLGILVYWLWGDDIFTETIEMICVSDKGFYLETENMGFDESDIGKVVFLTREAAEKALEDA